MMPHLRLTFAWHGPSIHFGPATVAPLVSPRANVRAGESKVGDPSLRRHMAMAAVPHREDKSDREDGSDKERLKAVELAVGQMEKQFGKGSIMRLGRKDGIQPIPFISTGSIS